MQDTSIAATPIGRRTSRGKRRWCLVHAPGREQATCKKVRKVIPKELLEDAFVMRRERVKKLHGERMACTPPMYTERFFVVTHDVNALDKVLGKLSFPAHVAKGDNRCWAYMETQIAGKSTRAVGGVLITRNEHLRPREQ